MDGLTMSAQIKLLVAALGVDDSEARATAAEALARLGDPRAVGALVEAFSGALSSWSNPDEDRIAGVFLPLVAQMGTAAVPPLVDILEGADADEGARFLAALALGTLGDPRGIEVMVAYLRENESEWLDDLLPTRKAAIAVLGRFGSDEALDLLLNMWSEAGEEVEAALRTLGLMNGQTLAAVVRNPDTFFEAKDAALHLLAQVSGQQALATIIEALADEEGSVVLTAIEMLSEIGDPQAIEPIIAHLDDSDGVPAEYLAAFGTAAVDPLLAALTDRELRARYVVIDALGLIGDSRALGPLADLMLRDEDKNLHKWAADAVKAIAEKCMEDK